METIKIVFLEGKKINLRPLRIDSDLETLTGFINDPEVRLYSNRVMPQSIYAAEKWINNLVKNITSEIVLAIEEKEGNKLIGITSLHHIDWINRTAESYTIISKDYWNLELGYNSDVKMILLDYAFSMLNLRKIYSSIIAYDQRSRECNEKCGYKKESVFKKHYFRNEKYHDKIIFSAHKKNWLLLWKEYEKSLPGSMLKLKSLS